MGPKLGFYTWLTDQVGNRGHARQLPANTPIVLDGGAIQHYFAADESGMELDWLTGGRISVFQRRIERTIYNLIVHCGEVIMVLDGVGTKNKFRTHAQRQIKRTHAGRTLIKARASGDLTTPAETIQEGKPPVQLAHVFNYCIMQIARECNKFRIVCAAEEGDPLTAKWVTETNAVGVLTNDSDFFVFGVPVVMIKTLEFHGNVPFASVITPDTVHQIMGFVTPHSIHYFGAMCGNDFVEPERLVTVHKRLIEEYGDSGMEDRLPLGKGVLITLVKLFRLRTADEVLDIVKQWDPAAYELIVEGAKFYSQTQVTLEKLSACPWQIPEFNSHINLTTKLMKKYHKRMMDNEGLDRWLRVVNYQQYMPPTFIELDNCAARQKHTGTLFHCKYAENTMLWCRAFLYGLLFTKGSDQTVLEYNRTIRTHNFRRVPCLYPTNSIVPENLADAVHPKLPDAQRKEGVLFALGLPNKLRLPEAHPTGSHMLHGLLVASLSILCIYYSVTKEDAVALLCSLVCKKQPVTNYDRFQKERHETFYLPNLFLYYLHHVCMVDAVFFSPFGWAETFISFDSDRWLTFQRKYDSMRTTCVDSFVESKSLYDMVSANLEDTLPAWQFFHGCDSFNDIIKTWEMQEEDYNLDHPHGHGFTGEIAWAYNDNSGWVQTYNGISGITCDGESSLIQCKVKPPTKYILKEGDYVHWRLSLTEDRAWITARAKPHEVQQAITTRKTPKSKSSPTATSEPKAKRSHQQRSSSSLSPTTTITTNTWRPEVLLPLILFVFDGCSTFPLAAILISLRCLYNIASSNSWLTMLIGGQITVILTAFVYHFLFSTIPTHLMFLCTLLSYLHILCAVRPYFTWAAWNIATAYVFGSVCVFVCRYWIIGLGGEPLSVAYIPFVANSMGLSAFRLCCLLLWRL